MIKACRKQPGHPQQNGRHERMRLTLKKETTRRPGSNSLQQQERFDAFVREFNAEGPHETLDMKCPVELYLASPRPYDGLPELIYPFHDGSMSRFYGVIPFKLPRLNAGGRLGAVRSSCKHHQPAFYR
jgi:hypothetical protein